MFVARSSEGGLTLVRCQWKLDGNAVCIGRVGDLEGTLHRFISFHSDSALSVNYSIALYDSYDADSLNGLGNTLTHNTTTDKTLRVSFTNDQVRPIYVSGPHLLVVTIASGKTVSFGTFDLYYTPSIEPAMVPGGIH